jgi:hypothetical protein
MYPVHTTALHNMAFTTCNESQYPNDVYTDTRFLRFRRLASYEIGSPGVECVGCLYRYRSPSRVFIDDGLKV